MPILAQEVDMLGFPMLLSQAPNARCRLLLPSMHLKVIQDPILFLLMLLLKIQIAQGVTGMCWLLIVVAASSMKWPGAIRRQMAAGMHIMVQFLILPLTIFGQMAGHQQMQQVCPYCLDWCAMMKWQQDKLIMPFGSFCHMLRIPTFGRHGTLMDN